MRAVVERMFNSQRYVSQKAVTGPSDLTDRTQPEAVFGQEDLKDGFWPTADGHD